jgi:hypothetical protein
MLVRRASNLAPDEPYTTTSTYVLTGGPLKVFSVDFTTSQAVCHCGNRGEPLGLPFARALPRAGALSARMGSNTTNWARGRTTPRA